MVRGRFFALVLVGFVGLAAGVQDAMGQTVRVVVKTGDRAMANGIEWEFGTIRPTSLWINDAGEVAFPGWVLANGVSSPERGLVVAGANGWALRSIGGSSDLTSISNVSIGGEMIENRTVFTADGSFGPPSIGDPVPGQEAATFVGSFNLDRIANDGTVVQLLRYDQGGILRTGIFAGYGPSLRLLEAPRAINGFGFTTNQPAVASGGRYAVAGEWRDETGVARRAIMLGDVDLESLVPVAIESQTAENLPEGVELWDFGMSLSTPSHSGIGINAHGDVVFNAWLWGAGVDGTNRAVIAVVRGGIARVLIRQGDPTPGGGTFNLSAMVPVAISDTGHVVTMVRDEGGYGRSDIVLLRIEPDGTIRELARPGQPVPGRSDGAVWSDLNSGLNGYSMNQRGDVLLVGSQDHVVFEASGVVRNVWAVGRSYLSGDGRIVRAVSWARSVLHDAGGNDGLGRRINASGQVCVASAPQLWNGPTQVLVVDPAGSPCDSVDFNYDASLFDPTDVDAFMSVFSEGPCVPAHAICGDADFNNDGAVGPEDVESFLSVFGEGPCV